MRIYRPESLRIGAHASKITAKAVVVPT